jgi:hypothetical protein
MAKSRQTLLILLVVTVFCNAGAAPDPKFFPDDPIHKMPAPLPVGKIAKRELNDNLDFFTQARAWKAVPGPPAGAVNTLGDVPDSEWFTNRHALHRMTREELQRGPSEAEPPVAPFTVTGGKNEGISIGFRMKDAKGRRYFVKADPIHHPELATSADVIVSKLLYAIGYNVPKNEIVVLKMSDLRLSNTAKFTLPDGRSRDMTRMDLEGLVREIPHYPDGSFRIMASLAIEGESIGPFQYQGVRPDDPNDIVPHEDRRDLRGLYVFYAWVNNTDARAGNTFDTIVEENGVRVVRHYLIDFGSALGSAGDSPKNASLGYEFIIPTPGEALGRILTLGLVPSKWELAHYPDFRGIGTFGSKPFDPDAWKSDYPNPAFQRRRLDDDYWAAKQVMAFTDDDIHAIVETACFTDFRATKYMTATLAERRDQIGRTFFSVVLPLDNFRVDNGTLLFDDLSVRYGFHVPREYAIQWSRFHNYTSTGEPIPDGTSAHLPVEIAQAPTGSYFYAVICAPDDLLKPVTVYLRKEDSGYRIVGIDRTW